MLLKQKMVLKNNLQQQIKQKWDTTQSSQTNTITHTHTQQSTQTNNTRKQHSPDKQSPLGNNTIKTRSPDKQTRLENNSPVTQLFQVFSAKAVLKSQDSKITEDRICYKIKKSINLS